MNDGTKTQHLRALSNAGQGQTLEVGQADAARAAVLLKEAMTAAFAVTFPSAPLRDLVAVKIGRSWAETK
jgi:hypothetical protein